MMTDLQKWRGIKPCMDLDHPSVGIVGRCVCGKRLRKPPPALASLYADQDAEIAAMRAEIAELKELVGA